MFKPFQSTPVISGGRNASASSRAVHIVCFNPRPSFLAGETTGTATLYLTAGVSIHARHFWRAKRVSVSMAQPSSEFQSTPVISGGRNVGLGGRPSRGTMVSIHARHFWRAKHLLSYQLNLGDKVSIHARHFWRAKPRCWPPWPSVATFQSTPVISGGRNLLTPDATPVLNVFQSTPVISGGRNTPDKVLTDSDDDVSIHARHFWRASPIDSTKALRLRAFQSTPVISGGRAARQARPSCPASGFNPRPSFLAGEPLPAGCWRHTWTVSIHARHFWRASLDHPSCPTTATPFQSTPVISGGRAVLPAPGEPVISGFNPRPSFLAGEPDGDGGFSAYCRVSIHARHFWRASPVGIAWRKYLLPFQSTPVISGGRAV